MAAIWRVWRAHRDLRLTLSAGLLSLSGDWILRTGLAYRVFVLTGSTVATGLLMIASFAPQVLLSPVAGVFADRWDRKWTMVVINLLLAGGLMPLLAVTNRTDVWIVVAVMFFEGAVQQFFSPAERAMFPRLVSEDERVTANAINGQNQNLSRLAGSALGGIVAAIGGIALVALVDAGTFVLSAALLTQIRTSGRVERTTSVQPLARSVKQQLATFRTDLDDGLRLTLQSRVLRVLIIFTLVTSAGEGIMGTLFAPFIRHVLHGSNQAYGLVLSVQAFGGIAGGLIVTTVAPRISAQRLLNLGAVAFGAVDLAIFCFPLGYVAVWPAVVGMVIVGVPGALLAAGVVTLLQQHTEDWYRGRVFGVLGAAEGIAILGGALTAGILGHYVGIIPVLALQGGSYVVAGLLLWMRWPTSG